MRFKKRHNRNGHQYEVGDKWTGDVDGGRFLYHRGILEPDGDPIDKFVTSAKPVRGVAWSDTDTFAAKPDASPADSAGEKETQHGDQE